VRDAQDGDIHLLSMENDEGLWRRLGIDGPNEAKASSTRHAITANAIIT